MFINTSFELTSTVTGFDGVIHCINGFPTMDRGVGSKFVLLM